MSDFAFAGKTFEIRLDNGVVYYNTYGPEANRLLSEQIDGATERGSEEVELHSGEVAPGIYLLGWNELSGTAVTHVMDFHKKTVTGFWSVDAGGARDGEIRTGTFREAD